VPLLQPLLVRTPVYCRSNRMRCRRLKTFCVDQARSSESPIFFHFMKISNFIVSTCINSYTSLSVCSSTCVSVTPVSVCAHQRVLVSTSVTFHISIINRLQHCQQCLKVCLCLDPFIIVFTCVIGYTSASVSACVPA